MRSTFNDLRGVFRDALIIALGAPALLAGCGDGGIEDDPGFVPVRCAGPEPRYLLGLSPPDGLDYIERHQLTTEGRLVVESVGTACSGASDPSACLAALAVPSLEPSYISLSGSEHPDGVYFPEEIRATNGDTVTVINSLDELVAFLRPIDTAAEALIVASTAGYATPCTRSGSKPASTGFEVQLFRYFGCGGRSRHLLVVSPDGEVREIDSEREVDPEPNCIVGRRPPRLVRRAARASSAVAEHWARSAELEAASVPAFEILRAELAAHAAPAAFGIRARAAARDEVRHARAVARLGRTYGARPRLPRVEPLTAPRSLEAIAIENAVEGCVRETYGALVALHQSRRAQDPRVRRLYTAIAADETRHAALAWDIARWAQARSGVATRQRVTAALRGAVEELRAAARAPVDGDLVAAAGVPAPDVASALIAQLQRSLWRAPLGA